MGKAVYGDSEKVFLMRGSQIYTAAKGDLLDGDFRLDDIGVYGIELTYIPLQIAQRISYARLAPKGNPAYVQDQEFASLPQQPSTVVPTQDATTGFAQDRDVAFDSPSMGALSGGARTNTTNHLVEVPAGSVRDPKMVRSATVTPQSKVTGSMVMLPPSGTMAILPAPTGGMDMTPGPTGIIPTEPNPIGVVPTLAPPTGQVPMGPEK